MLPYVKSKENSHIKTTKNSASLIYHFHYLVLLSLEVFPATSCAQKMMATCYSCTSIFYAGKHFDVKTASILQLGWGHPLLHHISLSLSFAFFQKVPFFPAPFPTSSHFLLYFPPIFGPFPPIFLPISPHILVSRGLGRILAVSPLKLNDIILPVRAAIPVRKIVVSIGLLDRGLFTVCD